MKTRVFLTTVGLLLVLVPNLFAFQASFAPRLSVAEEYTDNVFLAEDNTQSDFITTVAPGLTLGLEGKYAGLEMSYDPSYAFYDEFDENNTWRHQAGLKGWAQMGRRTRLEVRDAFLNTEDPLPESDIALIRTTDPSIPVDTSERRGRNRYTRNYAEINLNHQFGRDDRFWLGYGHTILENDDPTYEDSKTYRPFGGVMWWFLPFWGVELNGRYVRGEYEVSSDIEEIYGSLRLIRKFTPHLDGYLRYSQTNFDYEDVPGQTDETYNPSVGFDYLIAEDLTLNVDVGYFKNDFALREDVDGLTLDSILIKSFRRGSINFFARAGYDQPIGQSENLGYEQFASGGISATYRFTRFVSGNINGYYRYTDYIDSPVGRQDDQGRAGAGLSVMALSWMTIDLQYSYRLLDSTIDTNDYQENRGLFKITLAPAVPYRTSNY